MYPLCCEGVPADDPAAHMSKFAAERTRPRLIVFGVAKLIDRIPQRLVLATSGLPVQFNCADDLCGRHSFVERIGFG